MTQRPSFFQSKAQQNHLELNSQIRYTKVDVFKLLQMLQNGDSLMPAMFDDQNKKIKYQQSLPDSKKSNSDKKRKRDVPKLRRRIKRLTKRT